MSHTHDPDGTRIVVGYDGSEEATDAVRWAIGWAERQGLGVEMLSVLRALRQANLPETRLIVGSLDGDALYPDLDLMLAEPEFADLVGRVVVTAEPASLAQFASSSHVVSHQRRLLGAARGQG